MLREYRCLALYRSEDSWTRLKAANPAGELIGIAESGPALSEPLYAVVHLAGGYAEGGTPAVFQRMFETNVLSAVKTISLALPGLTDGGRIVAISSAASESRPPGLAAYSASKAALNAYIATLAAELKSRKITANALLPTALDSGDGTNGRFVRRENVAEMIALLLSPQGSNITGQLIGMTA